MKPRLIHYCACNPDKARQAKENRVFWLFRAGDEATGGKQTRKL